MKKNYKEWVKTATIDELINELHELYEQNQQNEEDFELYEECGEETKQNYYLVYLEIKTRAGGQ